MAWSEIGRAAAAAALLAALGCGGLWRTIDPPDAGFTVSMPAEPATRRALVETTAGDAETDVYSCDLDGGGVLTVMRSTLPEGVDVEKGADEILDAACDRAVESASGSLVAKERIAVGSRPGRRVRAEIPESVVEGGGRLEGRVLLAGRVLYHALAVVPKSDDAQAVADRFLESFRLKGR
jgi:hypothetical protein